MGAAHERSWSRMLAGDYPRVLDALSVWKSDTCCDARAAVGTGREASGEI